MSKWRIHWNNGVVSDWMETDALYNTVWAKEAFVLYIEREDMLPHIDAVLELIQQGHTAMSQWGEVLSFVPVEEGCLSGDYYIDEEPSTEWEVRAALQIRYTVDPEDYIEDKAYIEAMAAGSTL